MSIKISKSLLLFVAAVLFTLNKGVAQEFLPDVTHSLSNEIIENDPAAKQRRVALEAYTKQFMQQSQAQQRGTAVDSPKLYVPVVVHILHQNGTEAIDDDQVYDAIRILNRDFAKLNPDTAEVSATFKPIIGKPTIGFRLAHLDPNGKCTNGITRTYTDLTNDGMNSEGITKLINWDPKKYLNVYTVRRCGTAGGYSYLPGTFPDGDKRSGIIVILFTQFGSIGPSGGSNLSARSLTHEVGHFLNLQHTWGSTNTPGQASNCGMDDGVEDTPNTIGTSGGCNKGMASCSGDPVPVANVENYMDYSSCERMFTQQQVLRMRAAIRSNVNFRNNLWSESNLIATGTNDGFIPPKCIPIADFYGPSTGCTNTELVFNDISSRDTVTNREWVFEGGNPATSSEEQAAVSYPAPGKYKIKLKVSNAAGADSVIRENYVTIYSEIASQRAPLASGFEMGTFPLAGDGWRLETEDERTWEVTTAAAYSGNSSYYIKNWNGNGSGNLDAFVTPALNFTNANEVTLKFRLAYAARNSVAADAFSIYVSKNCGRSYTKQFGKSGATLATTTNSATSYTPKSKEEWKEFIVPLNSAIGAESVLIKFENKSGAGNNVYIDDLEIVTDEVITGISKTIRVGGLSIFPNPFENSTKVSFGLVTEEQVHLAIYNMLGQEIAVLANAKMHAGNHEILLNAQNEHLIEAGCYFVKLKAGNDYVIQKILLTK